MTRAVSARLARAGCVAAREEAEELVALAGDDPLLLEALVGRRTAGEPLAWVTGTTTFCGRPVAVHAGIYVPRWQTEPMARRAAALLPERGVAVDLCTGSGAVAAVLAGARPAATVLATDLDPAACACAATNGVQVRQGDLDGPLPPHLAGTVDVVTAVPPYVPTWALPSLPSDARDHEPPLALDGGHDGMAVLRRVVAAAGRLLRRDGALLVELGHDQDRLLEGTLATAQLAVRRRIVDSDGDLRAVEVVRAPGRRGGGPEAERSDGPVSNLSP